MLVIVRPGFTEISLGQMAMIVGAPFIAASLLLGKRLSRDEDPSMIVAMLSLFVTLTLLPGTILQWRTPTLEEFLWLSLTAAFATAAHYCLTKALQAAPITVTQPISFLQLVWASLVGLALFNEALDPYIFMDLNASAAASRSSTARETPDWRQRVCTSVKVGLEFPSPRPSPQGEGDDLS